MHLRSTERTAAKAHTCHFCGHRIEAGSRYIDGFGLWEGVEPAPWCAHLECQALCNALAPIGYDDGVPPFSDIDPDEWKEHPELGAQLDAIEKKYGVAQ